MTWYNFLLEWGWAILLVVIIIMGIYTIYFDWATGPPYEELQPPLQWECSEWECIENYNSTEVFNITRENYPINWDVYFDTPFMCFTGNDRVSRGIYRPICTQSIAYCDGSPEECNEKYELENCPYPPKEEFIRPSIEIRVYEIGEEPSEDDLDNSKCFRCVESIPNEMYFEYKAKCDYCYDKNKVKPDENGSVQWCVDECIESIEILKTCTKSTLTCDGSPEECKEMYG